MTRLVACPAVLYVRFARFDFILSVEQEVLVVVRDSLPNAIISAVFPHSQVVIRVACECALKIPVLSLHRLHRDVSDFQAVLGPVVSHQFGHE